MKQTINLYQFRDAFTAHNRTNFSYEGLGALFDWLESYEDDTGEELELDVIALCCDWTEYDDLADYNQQFGTEHESVEAIADDCIVIEIPDTDRFICSAH